MLSRANLKILLLQVMLVVVAMAVGFLICAVMGVSL